MTNNSPKIEKSIHYGSSSYVILCYAKMKNQPITVAQYLKFSLGRAEPSKVARSFHALVKYKLVNRIDDDHIIINESGRNHLKKIARKDKRSND